MHGLKYNYKLVNIRYSREEIRFRSERSRRGEYCWRLAFIDGLACLCITTWHGNPVLIGKPFFAEMQALTGDVGARPLISRHPEFTCEVAMDDDAVLVDIDTPQALPGLGG